MDEILSDGLFWACVGWVAANIIASHYLVKHYHLCVKGRGLIGRYVLGVLSFGVPFAVWCLNTEAVDALLAFAVLVLVAGGMTAFCYFVIDANADNAANSKTLDEVL